AYLEKNHHILLNRYAFQNAAMKECGKLFSENGIPHLFYKGLILADNYHSPDMRYMLDVDILAADKFETAKNVLCDLGYKITGSDDKHTEFFRSPFVSIELHRSLVTDRSVTDLDGYWSDISARMIEDGNEPSLYHMTTEDEYLFLISHIVLHILQNGGVGIRALLDVRLFLDRYGDSIDRSYIDAELDKMRCRNFEKRFTSLCGAILDEGQPTDEDAAMLKFLLLSGIRGSGKNYRAVRNTEKKGSVDYYRSILFPSYREMHGKYRWLEGKPYLLPAAWAVKAANGVRRKNAAILRRRKSETIDKIFRDFCLNEILRK
ncbi:MAG: nucleotidyltransferase family protein, partial [Clostridia bacterium]|nr:nucleotidyltransferase family protein [Clostridia bacterium]